MPLWLHLFDSQVLATQTLFTSWFRELDDNLKYRLQTHNSRTNGEWFVEIESSEKVGLFWHTTDGNCKSNLHIFRDISASLVWIKTCKHLWTDHGCYEELVSCTSSQLFYQIFTEVVNNHIPCMNAVLYFQILSYRSAEKNSMNISEMGRNETPWNSMC